MMQGRMLPLPYRRMRSSTWYRESRRCRTIWATGTVENVPVEYATNRRDPGGGVSRRLPSNRLPDSSGRRQSSCQQRESGFDPLKYLLETAAPSRSTSRGCGDFCGCRGERGAIQCRSHMEPLCQCPAALRSGIHDDRTYGYHRNFLMRWWMNCIKPPVRRIKCSTLTGDSTDCPPPYSISVVVPPIIDLGRLARALQSIEQQTHQPDEIIVVDDAPLTTPGRW